MATKKKAAQKTTARKQAKKPEGALSQLDAAAQVLAEAKEPMSCKAMVAAMAQKGYWSSPAGKTPSATLYSALLRHIQKQGKDARFVKVERGRFALASSKG